MLENITLEVADSMTLTEVALVVIRTAVAAFGAAGGMLAVPSGGGEALEIIGQQGFPETVVEPHRRLQLHPATPAMMVYRTRAPEFIETLAEFQDRYPSLASATTSVTGTRALLCIPLVLDGRSIGVFGVTYREDHRFSQEERAFALTFAEQAARALGRTLPRQEPWQYA